MQLSHVVLINVQIITPCSSDENIWVGLRFRNGSEWLWDNGSNQPVTWGSKYTFIT